MGGVGYAEPQNQLLCLLRRCHLDSLTKSKVAQLVKVLANCSSSDADLAAEKMCRDPESIVLLATACGLTTVMAVQGVTATKAAALVQAWPMVIAGAVFTGANAYAAKRFCVSVVKQTGSAIEHSSKWSLKSSLGQ
jgi:hypothetical protein